MVNENGSIFYGGFTFFLDEVIFYSNDLGSTWNSENFGSFNDLTSLYSDGINVYAGFNDQSIKYSDDDGETWQIFSAFSFGSHVKKMKKLSNGIFLAATSGNGVFFTSDNGNIWNSLSAGLPSGSLYSPNFIESDINNLLDTGYYSQGIYRNNTWENVVPVEFISFSASFNKNDVILNWITSSETNNSGFEVERLQNSKIATLQDWEKVGFVEGNGTTTETHNYSFTDNNLSPGKYNYRMKQIDFDGSFKYSDSMEVEIGIPENFALYQNYPNPFNPSTKIEFAVGSRQLAIIKIYDMLGKEISILVNEVKEPGIHEIEFNASEFSSGTYYYQLIAGDYVETRKLLLIK